MGNFFLVCGFQICKMGWEIFCETTEKKFQNSFFKENLKKNGMGKNGMGNFNFSKCIFSKQNKKILLKKNFPGTKKWQKRWTLQK